ncbi:farnesol dehydrogenase isoform X1 [Neodiprion lecontei]|uniref:Farnesol dehydrogenase isoform X1 n=2 Tax=Neodiprion TaxID=270857 RepID=A0A6J0BV53_NEOLC|nr:farnesol dehydrogenase isoform X1 [Neodiprion lecontei]
MPLAPFPLRIFFGREICVDICIHTLLMYSYVPGTRCSWEIIFLNIRTKSLSRLYVYIGGGLSLRNSPQVKSWLIENLQVAVVTGASAGIGAEVVKALVKKGFTVVGLARRKNRVQELATELKEEPGKLHACECDLTKEEDILAAFRWIKAQWGGVDVLVNNAGVFKLSTLTNGHTEDWKHILDINVLAVCICTRESMQLMEDREHCHVINICSVAGHRIPNLVPSFLHVYPASKHALRAISDSLRAECARNKRRIKVTNLSPGTVQTEMAAGLGNLSEKLTEEDMAELSQHKVTLQSKDIADAVLYVLETPPHVEIRELIIEPLGAVL